jgi:hypothetical protein
MQLSILWRPGRFSMPNGRWAKVAGFLLLGYLSMSRSFAYLGLPPLKVFIGELVLGAFLLLHLRTSLGTWIAALTKPTVLSGVAWALFLFFGYGVFQLLRGMLLGHPPFSALQNLVFNWYPLFLFMGLWVGGQQPGFLAAFIRLLAWGNGLYGIAYLLLLNSLRWMIPGSPDVPLFGQPGGSAVALVGLLVFEPRLIQIWPLLLLNSFVMFGLQVRGEWLGCLVAFMLWGGLTKQLSRVGRWAMTVVILLGIMYAADITLPGVVGRGGNISVQEMLGRALAPLNEELAAQYTERADSYAGTILWRTTWWWAIWDAVHADPIRTVVGHGYGYPLGDLVPYLQGEAIRTPHNVFFYALGYGGWLGVVFFFLFQLALAHTLLKSYRCTGQPFGLVFWALGLTQACFGNFLESPFGAIPFYLLAGLAIGQAMSMAWALRAWPAQAGAPEPTR